jgi:hypothetical protein
MMARSDIPNTWWAQAEESQVEGQRGLYVEFQPSLSCILKPCLDGGVAQVIEHLARKCKALSSSPNTAPQKT